MPDGVIDIFREVPESNLLTSPERLGVLHPVIERLVIDVTTDGITAKLPIVPREEEESMPHVIDLDRGRDHPIGQSADSEEDHRLAEEPLRIGPLTSREIGPAGEPIDSGMEPARQRPQPPIAVRPLVYQIVLPIAFDDLRVTVGEDPETIDSAAWPALIFPISRHRIRITR